MLHEFKQLITSSKNRLFIKIRKECYERSTTSDLLGRSQFVKVILFHRQTTFPSKKTLLTTLLTALQQYRAENIATGPPLVLLNIFMYLYGLWLESVKTREKSNRISIQVMKCISLKLRGVAKVFISRHIKFIRPPSRFCFFLYSQSERSK